MKVYVDISVICVKFTGTDMNISFVDGIIFTDVHQISHLLMVFRIPAAEQAFSISFEEGSVTSL